MLSIERFVNKRADDTYQRIVFKLPLAQHQEIFRQMIERGFVTDNNAEVLAQEYYAIIYLAFQKNCMGYNFTESSKKTACNEVRQNILDLYKKMKEGECR
jgi:Cft2 family RNA processing exonuclease